MEQIRIAPHPGPQTAFLSSPADLTVYGGSAGGGKSYGLLMEPLRHVTTNPKYSAVIFRRTTTQIRNPGGLWDQAMRLYPLCGGVPSSSVTEFRWPKGGKVKFAHLEHETTKLNYQGSEIPMIGFDEGTHFSDGQFFYMLSRNRSTSGVPGKMMMTTNPDADSWLAVLVSWWIDPATGFAIPERSGVLRWFVRQEDELVFGDSRDELIARYPHSLPKSLTFIGATLNDNPTLTSSDPAYRASLMALPRVERERLLEGNWLIRPSAGMYFQRGWCEFIDAAPADMTIKRGWDLAATPESAGTNPDWTCGTKMGRTPGGRYVVLDHVRLRGSPHDVERLVYNTASADGSRVVVDLPQDPGQAGKAQVLSLTRQLAGFMVSSSAESGDKVTRFGPFSSQAEAGNVLVLRGPWNDRWCTELEGFPTGTHDDDADSTSRVFNALMQVRPPMQISDEALFAAMRRN